MNFIIDGGYSKELISLISKEDLPVSHIIVHVPQNPIGNGSIFLPKNLPTFEEFKEYTKLIQDHGIIPIAGIDSTCQGNLEAHIDQHKAVITLFEQLLKMEYKDILVSSPNNISLIKANYSSIKIYLSYSQYITSLNRGRIFFNLGASLITLHSDIIRYFPVLKSFIKLRAKLKESREIDYILPLNIGCNWGCIQWYQHHNLQSHRTINSPVFPDQQKISSIEDEFDYPLLYCWKKRIEEPINILKAGWITPTNIEMYESMGFNNFLLLTSGFSNEKIIDIINSYVNKSLDISFNEFLNIPQPLGGYWPRNEVKNSLIQLKPNIIEDYCKNYPYYNYYPFEKEMNIYCQKYLNQLESVNSKEKEKIVELIVEKMQKAQEGAING